MHTNTDPEGARRTIVAGTDFTPASAIAMRRARQVASSTGSVLLLAHVVPEAAVMSVAPLPGEPVTIPMPSPSADGAAALKAATDLAHERIALELAGVDAASVVRVGVVAEELATVADLRRAWLLVVGIRDGDGQRRESLVLGTTAEIALRHGPTPVLLARQREAAPYRRVLLPLEPDDLSLLVARAVAVLAPDADYDVVHFLPPRGPGRTAAATHRAAVVAELTGLCAAGGLDPARTRVASFGADPRNGILVETRRRRPDLVAVGTHARSGLARVAFGSVADHVIHASVGVDVLAVPPDLPRRSLRRTALRAEAPSPARS